MSNSNNPKQIEFDPILMAVLGNRLNAIVREMSNTLLRTARSAVLAVVRDFSCSMVTADNEMLCPGEGLPVHIFGSSLQTAAMCELHKNLKPGDAYLHNDPYLGDYGKHICIRLSASATTSELTLQKESNRGKSIQ